MARFKYQELVAHFQSAIEQGVYQEGDKLPSVRKLAEQHKVSLSTANKVLQQLEQCNYVEARNKSGFYIKRVTRESRHGYGQAVFYKPDLLQLPLAQAVQYSFNDEEILPLSCTGPCTVLDNEGLLNKLHRKVLSKRPYRLQQDNFEAGHPQLRQALVKHFAESGIAISSEQLLITRGRADALQLAIHALQLCTKRIAIEAPCSFFINACLEQMGVETLAVPMQSDFNDELSLLDKAYQASPFSAYVFNPNFNDPTGRLLSVSEKQSLLAWAQTRNVALIEYDRGELAFSQPRPKPITALVNQDTQIPVISLGDFTDTVSFSFSLGYMICHNSADLCLFAKHVIAEKPDTTSQLMLAEMITSGEYRKLLGRLMKQTYHQYEQVQCALQSLQNKIEINQVQGGPCLWLKLPSGYSSEDLFKVLLAKNIAIAPGRMFLSTLQFEQYFRITYALPWDQKMNDGIELLVVKIAEFLNA